jgi:hypothetical protein
MHQVEDAEDTIAKTIVNWDLSLAEPNATIVMFQELVLACSSFAPPTLSSLSSNPDLSAFNKDRVSYLTWRLQVQAKLQENANDFLSKTAKCEYVFSLTFGLASNHLWGSQDQTTGKMCFSSAKEMLEFLNEQCGDPNS